MDCRAPRCQCMSPCLELEQDWFRRSPCCDEYVCICPTDEDLDAETAFYAQTVYGSRSDECNCSDPCCPCGGEKIGRP